MKCPERELELNMLVDGEIESDAEIGLLEHISICPNCAAELASLLALKSRLNRLIPVEAPTVELTARIERALRPYGGYKINKSLKMAGYIISSFAIAAAIILTIIPREDRATVQAIADAASRQSIAGTAIILADNRAGGADAWFKSQNLVAPPTPDLTRFGYKFIGCRTDVIAGHRASIVVYQRDNDQISLIVWPARDEPPHKPRFVNIHGDAMQYWNNGILEFWATGDDSKKVQDFTKYYRRSA
jgi:anti-sigma factor RsiW